MYFCGVNAAKAIKLEAWSKSLPQKPHPLPLPRRGVVRLSPVSPPGYKFFAKDCLISQSRLHGKTYLFCLKEQIDTVYRINKRRTMMEYNARLEFKANGTWKKVQ